MSAPYTYLEPSGGDDTLALQAAFDGLSSGMIALRGKYNVSKMLYLRDKSGILLDGVGATIQGGGLDMQGTGRTRIRGLSLVGDLVYGRGATGNGGDLRLQDVEISGSVSIAQADTSSFDAVYIHGPLVLSDMHAGVWKDSTFKGSSWRDCWLDGGVIMRGQVQNVKFDTCYFSRCSVCVSVEDYPDAGERNQCHNISFYNCNAEAADVFLRVSNLYGLQNTTINNLNWSCDTPHIIEIDTPYQLRNAYIQNISRSNPATETFKVVRGKLENVWYDGRLIE